MLLHLTDLSDESLQGQIVRQIRAKILAGDLATGADLPSIRGLARDQRVSVITVQRAYESLERQGLIHSRRSRGFFVSELTQVDRKAMAREKLIEDLEPVLRAALDEGLKAEDVLRSIGGLLEKIETD